MPLLHHTAEPRIGMPQQKRQKKLSVGAVRGRWPLMMAGCAARRAAVVAASVEGLGPFKLVPFYFKLSFKFKLKYFGSCLR